MADSNSILPAWGCNICFEESRDPVCTTCGHLFCWPCLYTWIHDRAKSCPVCRSSLSTIACIIPVYGTTRREPPPPPAAQIIPPRPRPPRGIPTAWDALLQANREHMDQLSQQNRQAAVDRARLARAEERIAVNAEAPSRATMRRHLNDIAERRRIRNANAVDTATSRSQASTSDARTSNGNRASLDRPILDGNDLRRILDAILGRSSL